MAAPNKALTSKQLAQRIALFAHDKKAQAINILDMRKLVNFCDFFVVASGTSDRHVRAIAEGIESDLALLGVKVNLGKGVKHAHALGSGAEHGAWMLLDMGDVVVHIFEPAAREFYALEHLWQDAPMVTHRVRKTRRPKI